MTAGRPDGEGASYRLTVAYLGTRYAGWQRQPNAVTVQSVLEEAIDRVVGEEVRVVGSGRTDAGVHARGQVASLRLSRSWPLSALVHGANRYLPDDVRVLEAAVCEPSFHPQRDALAKEYRYRLVACPVLSPLDAPTSVRVDPATDFEAIVAATRALEGTHDFAAFAKTGGSHRESVRTIFGAAWVRGGDERILRIVGDGFLRGMVRALVGTLLEVGRGRRDLEGLERLLQGSGRGEAGPNAPAEGLVLQRVLYDRAALEGLREELS